MLKGFVFECKGNGGGVGDWRVGWQAATCSPVPLHVGNPMALLTASAAWPLGCWGPGRVAHRL